jgi:pimeloyl-ACP methyl ester carboxylesterase
VLTGALVIAGLLLRDTTPVGHFHSASGYDHFFATYERAMQALPKPGAILDLRTSFGIVRFYRFDGANPDAAPLVLIPGRASASPIWADNLPSLLRLRTVYTLDLLGEPGASIQGRPIESEADQARWLREALAKLPEPQVHLLGVSIGGWTAMNLAVHQPEKIVSIILLDPVYTFADLSPQVIIRSLPASIPWLPKGWRDSFNSWTAGGAPVDDVPVAQMIEAGMQSYALKLPVPTRIPAEAIAKLDRPVLVIIAGKSVMHDPVAAAYNARTTLKRGTVLTYQDASHAMNGEYPDRIAADVAAFLATVEPAER